MLPPDQRSPSLWIRLADVVFVAIAIIDFYNSLVIYPVVIIPALSLLKPVVFGLNLVVTAGALLGLAFFFIRWQRDARGGIPDSGRRHAWCAGIIRYWLAVEIFNYAFAKVLGTQFGVNYFRGDSTWNSLPGFDLMWNFFGYSSILANIIAVLQIAGAALLLFRRTTVAGALLLLPVMVNIVLLDIFFHLPAGALANACLFTAALLYLVGLHYQAVVVFLKQAQLKAPPIRFKGLKPVLRLLMAAYALGFIYFVTTTGQPASITGKWDVRQLVINRDTVKPLDWLHNAKAWQHVYLETYGRATFTPNPYVVEAGRSTVGAYRYDDKQHTIAFSLHPDTGGDVVAYQARVNRTSDQNMDWTMTSKHDTIRLALTKVQ